MSELDIPTSPEARTAWVQYRLRLAGSNFSFIARKHGWSRRSVAMAMRVPSYPQEAAIAQELGLPVERLFPERYDSEGRRLHRTREDSRQRCPVHVKDSAAA